MTIPDYFRMLFYENFDLSPDFAFNLGNGQNIYNFVYYGLLSPIILVSYILPFIKMSDYIVLSSILSVIASSILFYIWIRKNHDGDYLPSFLASFVLMFSTSLSFHAHRHIMFINYMPFIILALFGVDKKLLDKKGWLLSLSTFLMVMTSFYYSVGGIITIVIYGIFRWIKITDKPSATKFFIDGFKFLSPIIIGIICSSVILLPTFHVITSSRGETFNSITIKDLFTPGVNIDYMLYNTYGVGLTSILIIAIIHLFFQKKDRLFLGISLALAIIFPFINYILNATMYIDAKSLIPVLPLAVLAIYYLICDLLEKKIDFKKIYATLIVVTLFIILKGNLVNYFLIDLMFITSGIFLYMKFNRVLLLVIPIMFIPFFVSTAVSLSDEYVILENKNDIDKEMSEVISSITEDDKGKYRISNAKTILRDVNNLYGNIDYYTSTLYSSTYNMGYNKFYYDVMNNPIQNRNRVITSPTSNLLFLMFSSNKYLIDNKANYFGYELYKTIEDDKIFKNENVLPIMYARSEVMSVADAEKLKYPDRALALLKTVVVEDKSSNNFVSSIEKFDFDPSRLTLKDVHITDDGDYYTVDANDKSKGTYSLPEAYQNKIIFIRFKMLDSASCSDGDTHIIIDGVKNKLTCKSWKYHNQNYDFDYILSNRDLKDISISFSKGKYRISNIELYSLDYSELEGISNSVDEFTFDLEKTKGDFIVGDIDVTDDGYFVSSIPYDSGFIVKVDGKNIDYRKVNETFLGFPIDKGHHHIEIEYRSPLKKEGLMLSGIGSMVLIIITFVEERKSKKSAHS